jgi:hypothetical protein
VAVRAPRSWFAALFTLAVSALDPTRYWYGPVMFRSHPFANLLLHKDEPGRRFPRAIRPLWPAPYCLQLVQWSEVTRWGKWPVIPLLLQVASWWWYLAG